MISPQTTRATKFATFVFLVLAAIEFVRGDNISAGFDVIIAALLMLLVGQDRIERENAEVGRAMLMTVGASAKTNASSISTFIVRTAGVAGELGAFVSLYDGEILIAHWGVDDWRDDPVVVVSIVEAIRAGYELGATAAWTEVKR